MWRFVEWNSCSQVPAGGASAIPTFDCINTVFQNLLNPAFALAGAIAVILFIVAGIRFIMSKGSSDQVESAKKMLTYAIIGLFIIFFAYAIINFILAIVTPGASIWSLTNPNLPNPPPGN